MPHYEHRAVSDSVTLFGHYAELTEVFFLLPEIADTPLGELNKDTVKRNIRKPDK